MGWDPGLVNIILSHLHSDWLRDGHVTLDEPIRALPWALYIDAG